MKNRYHSAIIIIHWLMALSFFWMLSSGFLMVNFNIDLSLKFRFYQWHKASGVILLMLVLLRIIVRILTKSPKLPKEILKTEARLAKIGHLALYLFMILMPLTGWIIVSSSIYGLPTIVFGLFEWPHISAIAGSEKIESLAKNLHFYFAIIFSFLITLHIGAAIKHVLIDKINLLKRMWW
jgi:cytochrome b561